MAEPHDEEDDRFAIRGATPEAQTFRLAASFSDYDPDERRQTAGAMRTVGLAVLVISVVLVGLGWWML